MGTATVSARWSGKELDFIGSDDRGHEVLMGKGRISPTKMMLMGLAGCMGMDVLSILQKKRQNISDVEVKVLGHVNDEYPKFYHTIELAFTIKGEAVDEQAVDRAIELSMEKYCIVGQTLKNHAEITTTFTIEP